MYKNFCITVFFRIQYFSHSFSLMFRSHLSRLFLYVYVCVCTYIKHVYRVIKAVYLDMTDTSKHTCCWGVCTTRITSTYQYKWFVFVVIFQFYCSNSWFLQLNTIWRICVCMYVYTCVCVCIYNVKKQSDIYHLCLYEVHVLFLLGLFLTLYIHTHKCTCLRHVWHTYSNIAFYSDWILFRIYHVYDDDDDVDDDDALEKMMPFGMSMDAVHTHMYINVCTYT